MDFWNNFWDLIWWFVWAFVFVAYLVVLFHIVGDLFRDRGLGGWAKAAWMLGLILVPYLTAVIYLIARGRGMAERSARAAGSAREEAEAYIRQVAGSSPADEISKARALLEAGAITPAEYEALKANALTSARGAPSAPVGDGEHGRRALT